MGMGFVETSNGGALTGVGESSKGCSKLIRLFNLPPSAKSLAFYVPMGRNLMPL